MSRIGRTRPKLVSLNMGISLVILKDGKEQKISYSLTCPSEFVKHPSEALQAMCDFVNDEFGTHYFVESVGGVITVAKRQIKAPTPVISQEEFNKKIKELVP